MNISQPQRQKSEYPRYLILVLTFPVSQWMQFHVIVGF